MPRSAWDQTQSTLSDLVEYAASPWAGQAMARNTLENMFGPAPTPFRFLHDYPVELAMRPSQLKASAEETGMLAGDLFAFEGRYRELKVPVTIVAGSDDRVLNAHEQSARLHRDLPNSTLHLVKGSGHMVPHTGHAEVMAAIDQASAG